MNLLHNQSLIKFDRQFPVYNFFFPNQTANLSVKPLSHVLQSVVGRTRSRALYFHIPFCDTICNFCPFTRGKYSSRTAIDSYFADLLTEIRLKSDVVDLKSTPVQAIFFGGGTPSLLDASQILQIGELIKHTFDLSQLREFSFEIEVKSLTRERADAMQAIGVTHPRFGLQTFNANWRNMFDLTASLQQIYAATELLKERFPFQTFDILYGMNGQSEDEVIDDLQAAVAMQTTNVDIYPIDNVMTQVGLHGKLSQAKLSPTSAMRKFSMGVLVDQFMRHAGFMPHNGHGYVRTAPTADIVSDAYSFVYHEHVYGYHDFDLLGFGTNAISSTLGHVITNSHNKNVYHQQLASGAIPCTITEHELSLDYVRPLVLRLGYHGCVEKGKIHWDRVHPEVLVKLDHLKREALIEEDDLTLRLTKLGWYWYVNIMYYLMPKSEQIAINSFVVRKLKEPGRRFEKEELVYPVIPIGTATDASSSNR